MNRDLAMRRTLFVGALFNLFASAMVLLPESLGRLADLPQPAPRFHSWLLAFSIFLWGGIYAWLSRRPSIDRPLVTAAIIGKTGIFLIALTCLFLGEISIKAFIPAVGDLLFAGIFLWWLNGRRIHLTLQGDKQ